MDAEASVGHTTGMSGNVGQTGAPTKRRAACSATKEEQVYHFFHLCSIEDDLFPQYTTMVLNLDK